ncbi:hypothetical protein B0G73_14037 [Paraburkholderia sp. BL25I1N1]|nr:hypothetical protein B0G73_14037 [Paraburkholderia sp. BL25I1N1]
MKRDGRSLAHNTLEEMRILAVQRMAEGEHPNDVAGFCRNKELARAHQKLERHRSTHSNYTTTLQGLFSMLRIMLFDALCELRDEPRHGHLGPPCNMRRHDQIGARIR